MGLKAMKMGIGILLSLILYLPPASAGTAYVDDLHKITVRLGPGVDYKIIQTVPSGTRLATVDTKNGWTRVRLSDSRKGWVVRRYLTDEMPDSKKYEALKKKCAPLEKQVDKLKAANSTLQKDNRVLSKKLAGARDALATTRANYEELKAASADVLKLKSENEKLASRLKKKRQKIASLENRVSDALLSKALKWFLAGAGVLILGIIIGASGRRKRSSLL